MRRSSRGRWLTRRQEQSGAVAIIVAVAAAVLFMPLAAISVDAARWYVEVEQVQKAADAASMAGVTYLPDDFAAAKAKAIAVSARNGYPNSGTSTVAVAYGDRATKLRVTVSSQIPNQFGASFGRGRTTITRSAVADYNGPAPMGSPCNTYGNEPDGTPNAGPASSQLVVPSGATCPRTPQFWAVAEGPNVYKTQGDRYLTRYCAGNEYGCTGGSPSKNTEFDPLGHFYTVHVGKDAVNTPISIQLYDPAYVETGQTCASAPARYSTDYPALTNNWNDYAPDAKTHTNTQGGASVTGRYVQANNDYCTGDSSSAGLRVGDDVPVVTSFALRRPVDTGIPSKAPAETQCAPTQYRGYTSEQAYTEYLRKASKYYRDYLARVLHAWVPFCTFTPATAGDYYLQVRTNVALGGSPQLGGTSYTGNQNVLTQTGDDPSVLGSTTNAFAIRAISTKAGAISVSGYDHMTIYANADSANPVFNLVRVVKAAAGQTLALSFFDVGDATGSGTLRILPPTESSMSLNACQFTGPEPTRTTTATLSNCTATGIDGQTASKGWNGGLATIRIPIPSTYTCDETSSGGCWWRVQVGFTNSDGSAAQVHDVTTWKATIQGNPVRLIE